MLIKMNAPLSTQIDLKTDELNNVNSSNIKGVPQFKYDYCH